MATDVTVISAATMARKRLLPWPQKSNDYQWKGTISETKITTKILAHCLPKQQDVIVESVYVDKAGLRGVYKVHSCSLLPIVNENVVFG